MGRGRSTRTRDIAETGFSADLLSSVKDAVLVTDSHNRVIYLNESAEKICGIKSSEVLGQATDRVWRCFWTRPEDEWEAHRSLVNEGAWTGDSLLSNGNGEKVDIRVSLNLLRHPNERPARVLAFVRDITELKKSERVLAYCHERYQTAAAAFENAISYP